MEYINQEVISNYINKYREDLSSVLKYWTNGDGVYSKSEIIDFINITHTIFTERIDNLWLHDKLSTPQWSQLQTIAFKEYRKAVHSL